MTFVNFDTCQRNEGQTVHTVLKFISTGRSQQDCMPIKQGMHGVKQARMHHTETVGLLASP